VHTDAHYGHESRGLQGEDGQASATDDRGKEERLRLARTRAERLSTRGTRRVRRENMIGLAWVSMYDSTCVSASECLAGTYRSSTSTPRARLATPTRLAALDVTTRI
jgi:hypothetical protein